MKFATTLLVLLTSALSIASSIETDQNLVFPISRESYNNSNQSGLPILLGNVSVNYNRTNKVENELQHSCIQKQMNELKVAVEQMGMSAKEFSKLYFAKKDIIRGVFYVNLWDSSSTRVSANSSATLTLKASTIYSNDKVGDNQQIDIDAALVADSNGEVSCKTINADTFIRFITQKPLL